jgi:hypothetical protein
MESAYDWAQAELDHLWDTPSGHLARNDDPDTSVLAARHVSYRSGSQKARLLEQYRSYPSGLTDEEASELAGIKNGWKRCSDLRNDGRIERIGTTTGDAGEKVMVCRYVEGR